MTDGHGRTVDFRNTVVIMTSNLGSHHFREVADPDKVRPLVLEELRQHLRPEFLNRIDEVIVFRPLGLDEIKQVVDIQAAHLRKRLAEKRITPRAHATAPRRCSPGRASTRCSGRVR